jgi:hypothetical protein
LIDVIDDMEHVERRDVLVAVDVRRLFDSLDRR